MTAQIPHRTQSSNELPVAVVAGGAGFLGSALCEALLTQNCQVIAIDNLKTGNLENLKNCEGKHNFFFIEADLNKELPAFPNNVTYIFHLAGVEEYINGLDISLDTLLVNSLGTKNLLEVARERQAKFLLASTLEIFQAIFSSWKINKNLGIGDSQTQAFSHHEAKRYAEALTTEYYKKFDLDTRIVRFLDLYGPRMDLKAGTPIAKLISHALEENNITILGDGLKTLYPTFISDVVYGITKSMFGQNTKGKIYTLVNPKSVSLLNLAYTVQKLLPQKPKIDFSKDGNDMPNLERDTKMEIEKTIEELGWRPKIDLQEGLAQTLDYFAGRKITIDPERPQSTGEENEKTSKVISIDNNQTEEPPKPELKEESKHHKLKIPKIRFPKIRLKNKKLLFPVFLLIILFSFVFYPVFSLVSNTKSGITSLKNSKNLLQDGKLEEASKEIEKANSSFLEARTKIDEVGFLANLAGQSKLRDETTKVLDISVKGTSSLKHLVLSLSPLITIVPGIEQNSNIDVRSGLNESRLELEKGSDELGEILATVKTNKVNTDIWPLNMYKNEINSLVDNLPAYQALLSRAQTLSKTLPELIGLNGRRTYLLLFQNNMELRPTGGFIGSYGILTMNDGKMLDLKIEDVYTADGQLKGKIFPPGPITKYMGQPNWYLRDSNWSPDFKTSAEKAEYFLEKETGQLVDGVVSIDVSTIVEILKATGPIALPEYKETITGENLYEKTQVYSEKDFFPGSTQKKDFLATLNQRLLTQLFQAPKSKWLALIGAINKSLNEKHILVNFHDPNTQKLISEFGWNGGITIFTPANSDCLSLGITCDYLQIVESNFGANKANYFLDRNIDHQIVFGRAGEIEEKVTITYENKSTSNAWPGGTYKNYIRIYTPQNSSLLRVDLDDKSASISAHTDTEKPKTKPGELDVEIATESAKTSFGFFVEVPIQTKKTVSLSYRLPYNLSFLKEDTVYKFYMQKQAGTLTDNFALNLNLPSFYKVNKQDPSGTLQSQTLRYNTKLDTNKTFSIGISKSSN